MSIIPRKIYEKGSRYELYAIGWKVGKGFEKEIILLSLYSCYTEQQTKKITLEENGYARRCVL
jgi:hypothetical protein